MSKINEFAIQHVFEPEINLYNSDEAGKTCQKVLINGKESNINDFKKTHQKERGIVKMKKHNWAKKHGFEPTY